MSFHRVMMAALAALFVTGTASVALAGCGGCGWSGVAPFANAPAPLYVSGGCGGCGSLAVTYAPAVYAPPAFAPAPPPIAPAPIAVDHWDTGGWSGCGWGGCGGIGCGCGSCGCGRGLLYGLLAAPAPIYVVNQGPEYTGPGIMVPYHTYSPQRVSWLPTTIPIFQAGVTAMATATATVIAMATVTATATRTPTITELVRASPMANAPMFVRTTTATGRLDMVTAMGIRIARSSMRNY